MTNISKPLFRNTAMPVRTDHNYAVIGKSGVVLRHAQFLHDMGSHSVTVHNVGYRLGKKGEIIRNPLGLWCDPLSQSEGGLTPDSGPIYDCMALLAEHFVREQMLMAIVADAHVDSRHYNRQALTEVVITPDYYNQLTAEEKAIADEYYTHMMEIPSAEERQKDINRAARLPNSVEALSGNRWLRYQQEGLQLPDDGQAGSRLTVADLEMIHGESPDGEFRDFLFKIPHCVEPTAIGGEGLRRFVPVAGNILGENMRNLIDARRNGVVAPETRAVSIHKNDLYPNVPNGARGTDGNLMDELLKASQAGMPHGPAHDHQRRVIVWGMGTPYTCLYSCLYALAHGFRVTLQMTATFNFDVAGISMIEVARFLRHLFPFAFEARFYWDEELLGPEPRDERGRSYNELAKPVVRMLINHWKATGGAELNTDFYAFSDPNLLLQAIADDMLAV